MTLATERVVVITGTRKGIGRYLAESLLADGWIVAGLNRNPTDLNHPAYTDFQVDITDEMNVVKAVRSVARARGRIDALINNAGTAMMNHILTSPTGRFSEVLGINVTGSFICLRECAKNMRRRKHGRIINISSVASALNLEGEAAYAASKAAVESLTRIAARELAEFGITVNAIGPTPIDTDLIRAVPEVKIESLLNRQPIRRMGTFEDVANVIEFFLRPESDFITGQTIYLGGVC